MAGRPTRVWFSEALLEQLDQHCSREGRSRSDVVREAVALYLDADIDRQIVDAYSREPMRDVWVGTLAARQLIEEEPW